jgi:predicted transcriptional regulator
MIHRSTPSPHESAASLPSSQQTSTDVTFDSRVETCSAILAALGDEDCRSIICAADEPLTARELARTCDIPLSTVYRKLEQLENTPLLESTTRARLRGKHPQQYQRPTDHVQIDIDMPAPCNFDVDVSVNLRETKTPKLGSSVFPRTGNL